MCEGMQCVLGGVRGVRGARDVSTRFLGPHHL